MTFDTKHARFYEHAVYVFEAKIPITLNLPSRAGLAGHELQQIKVISLSRDQQKGSSDFE